MTNTVLTKIVFAPGFNKNTTPFGAMNNWVDGDKVRFRNGKAEKIGGWVRETVAQSTDATNLKFTGITRDVLSWTDLNSIKYMASGSHKKLELMTGNLIYDISPIASSNNLTNAISTIISTSTVTITQTNHGLLVGDFVIVNSQAVAVGGITLSGEYAVQSVTDTNNYVLESGVIATGTVALGGGALSIDYLLPIGSQDNGNITGYGGGTWDTPGLSNGGYGTPREGIGGIFLRQWSLDNWGEDLIACVREGKIYQWDTTNGVTTRVQPILNAPTQNFLIKVAQPSRHLVAFGTQLEINNVFDPLVIRWTSQETLTDWTTSPGNSAGEFRLPLGNIIVGVVQTRGEFIIFTDSTVYSMKFVGGNDVFSFEFLADNTSAASQHCGTDVNGIVYWMGIDNFYMYDGTVRVLPSTLNEFIFDQDGGARLNLEQNEKVFCATNNEFNEVIWLYPSEAGLEIDRYVLYNTLENTWYDGTLDRTVWLDRNTFPKPFSLDMSGTLFTHEEGKDDDGSAMSAFIESGEITLQDGEDMMFIDRFVPDFKLVPNRNANLFITTKKYPSEIGVTKGPLAFNNNTKKISLRARGRHVTIKYQVDTIGADFEVGSPRLGIQIDGER